MSTQNTGFQSWFVLEQKNLTTGDLTGYVKPNLQQNSPQAVVPDTAVITYNYPDDVDPTGGSDDDIWYNPNADQLFKKISSTWVLLTDRITDTDYIAPVLNIDSCPLPT